MTVYYEGKLRVRPSVLYNRLQVPVGRPLFAGKTATDPDQLFAPGYFPVFEMQYTPRDTTRRQDTLDLKINTVYDLPLDGELEVNVTSKSNDQVGPGAIFSVTKRNVFGGGETFGVACAVLTNGRPATGWMVPNRPSTAGRWG